MHKNFLTGVGITILFLGVSINPAIAVNPISSNNEEDCNICPKVSNLQVVRLKRLIGRVETLNNKLSVMSKLNPKIAEQYQELSDRITTLTEMNKADRDYPIICNILYLYMVGFHYTKFALFYSIIEILPKILFEFLFWLYLFRNIIPFFTALYLYVSQFNCDIYMYFPLLLVKSIRRS